MIIGIFLLQRVRNEEPASPHPMGKPAGYFQFEEHCVVTTFESDDINQLSLECGAHVHVLNKSESGVCV